MQYFSLTSLLSLALATTAASTIAGCGPVCDLDAHGRQLTFPYKLVSATVYATTTNIIYFRDLKGSQIISTATRTARQPPKPTFTWKVSGVTLTYPTTYVIYTSFVHSYVVGEGQSGACQTKSLPLRIGNLTNYASLVYPAASITGTLPPAFLVNYLESIPTVYRQLGGHVNSSCDPVTTTTSSSSSLLPGQSGTDTLTTTDFVPSATITTQTISVPAQFDSTSGSSLSLLLTTPRFMNTTRPRTTSTTSTSSSVSTTTKVSLSIAPISSSLIRGSSFVSASSSAVSSALSELSSSLGQTSVTSETSSTTTGSSTTSTGSGGGGFSNAAGQVNPDTAGVTFGYLTAALLGLASWCL